MVVADDFSSSEMGSGMWWRHLTTGGITGAVSRTCTAPLDRMKLLLQMQKERGKIRDSFRDMIKEGGVLSMWRGNTITVLKIAPETAFKFAGYEKLKAVIRGSENRELKLGERFLAGAFASVISQTAIYPIEVLKTRLALRKTGQYKGIVDAALKIFLREGLRCFYRGYIPNMLGIMPYAGIDLAVYETLKNKYVSTHNNEQPSVMALLAYGSVSSTLGMVWAYPFSLIRTRLQAEASSINNTDKNMSDAFKRILRTDGVFGLYRGITPNLIKVLPAVSISYVFYGVRQKSIGCQ